MPLLRQQQWNLSIFRFLSAPVVMATPNQHKHIIEQTVIFLSSLSIILSFQNHMKHFAAISIYTKSLMLLQQLLSLNSQSHKILIYFYLVLCLPLASNSISLSSDFVFSHNESGCLVSPAFPSLQLCSFKFVQSA